MSTQLQDVLVPTPGSGDNSTKPASTAWCLLGFAVLLSANGYIKLPTWMGGFMIQWGSATGLADNSPTTFSFPLPWPNVCFSLVANDNSGYATSGNPRIMGCTVLSTTQFTIESSGAGASAFWIAVGH